MTPHIATTLRYLAVPAALLLGGLTLATTATAAVYQVQFTGRLTDLTDPRAVFGGAAVGQTVVATLRIDDGSPGADIRQFISGYGSEFGVYGAAIVATLRLNGASYSFGDGIGAINRVNFLRPGFNSYDGIFTNLSGSVPDASTLLSAYATSTTVDFLEQSPFGDFYGSPLDFDATGPNGLTSLGSFVIGYIHGAPASGDFTVDRIVVSLAPGVPEPAAWSLMIGGFGLVGAALRRRTPTLDGATRCA